MSSQERTGMLRQPYQPSCKLFEIHGSKLQPAPVGSLGKAAERRITHRVFSFALEKNALIFLLALFVKSLAIRRVTRILCQRNEIIPNVLRHTCLRLVIFSFEIGLSRIKTVSYIYILSIKRARIIKQYQAASRRDETQAIHGSANALHSGKNKRLRLSVNAFSDIIESAF